MRIGGSHLGQTYGLVLGMRQDSPSRGGLWTLRWNCPSQPGQISIWPPSDTQGWQPTYPPPFLGDSESGRWLRPGEWTLPPQPILLKAWETALWATLRAHGHYTGKRGSALDNGAKSPSQGVTPFYANGLVEWTPNNESSHNHA
ncbi:hypothetical protein PCASD_02492 [Puccinia coronata f. sp. avenae]|uniref:Uncharacterized protein n=1 Tax=Puccinia coronata f. sp. avenae TaxID=200324 RepID=A0A2N5VME0_9BASI|nr:hypothetical protein PCASD_02492 [Puccinia coronata f. sp. avenae]